MNLGVDTPIQTNNLTEAESYTILIADDNPTNLSVLSNYLKNHGFRILVARSGESALKKADYVRPNIILLDVMMPGIDGFETCMRLKVNSNTKDIPVIFMTALSSAEDKVKGFKVGAVDYVIKPLQYEEVLARVTTHLRLRDLTLDLQEQNERLIETTNELHEVNMVLSKRAIQVEAGSKVGQQVTSTLDLDELLTKIVTLLQSTFGYYFVGIWLRNEQDDALVLQAEAGATREDVLPEGMEIALNIKDNPLVKVTRSGDFFLAQEIDPHGTTITTRLPNTASELVVPLRVGRKKIGVLSVQSDQTVNFRNEDRVVLQTLADQVATAIRNAQLYKSEQYRRLFAETLEQTGRALSMQLDMNLVPEKILKQLKPVVDYERGAVLLRHENELWTKAHYGFPDDERAKNMHITLRQGDVFQQIMETKSPVIVDDVTQESGWQQVDWLPLNHSWLGVPLISKDRVMGMISLTRKEVGSFKVEDSTFIMAFASQAAIALENALLYDEINRLNEDLEEKVSERTAKLQALDRAKNHFIQATSHELRTPISVIRGYSQVLNVLPDISKNEQASDLLEGIINGVDRLYQVVNRIIEAAKVDQILELETEQISLAKLFEELRIDLTKNLNQREQTIVLQGVETLPKLEADPDLLHKAFLNLLVNAIKYTPDGGEIMVLGERVTLEDTEEAVKIIIADTGIGIAKEHHELIFEKFYQTGEIALHSSGYTKFKAGGPGLGLAIVKGVVQAHRGRVWVESEGHDEQNYPGSEFQVVLPLTQPNIAKK